MIIFPKSIEHHGGRQQGAITSNSLASQTNSKLCFSVQNVVNFSQNKHLISKHLTFFKLTELLSHVI